MPSKSIRIILTLVFAASSLTAHAEGPAIKVSKHTTRFTGPLNDDGSVNYFEAVNLHFEGEIKPEENAAVIIYELLGPKPEQAEMPQGFYKRLGTTRPSADGRYFIGLGQWMKEQSGGDWNKAQDRYYEVDKIVSTRPWKKKEAPEVVDWLKAMDGQLARLKEAVARPKYFLPMVPTADEDGAKGMMIGVLLPGVQITRSLARALNRRAYLALGEKRYEDALKDLLTCIRLGRHIGQGATLIERLVGIAVESIAKDTMERWIELAKPDLNTVNQIRGEMASMQAIPTMADSVAVCERAMFLDIVSALAEKRTDLGEIAGFGGDTAVIRNVQSVAGAFIDWDIVLRRGNEWYDRMAAAMREPTRAERQKAGEQIEQDLENITAKVKDASIWSQALLPGQTKKTISEQMASALMSLLLPALNAASTAGDRCLQTDVNLDVALGLAAFHKDLGRYPESLDELTPKYIPEQPADLFTRGGLKYQRTKDGYFFYSLGPNGVDDDGRWYDDEPAGDDLSVRMPVPAPKVDD